MNNLLYKRRWKIFCELLQHERNCCLLSQDEVAQKSGIRQDVISKIEKGKRRIDVIELVFYCEAMNYSLVEFAEKMEGVLAGHGVWERPQKKRFKQIK